MIYENGCDEIVKNFKRVENDGLFSPDKIP